MVKLSNATVLHPVGANNSGMGAVARSTGKGQRAVP
jgi:hypothetical protein